MAGRLSGTGGRDCSLRGWPGVCNEVIAGIAANLKLCEVGAFIISPGSYYSEGKGAVVGIYIDNNKTTTTALFSPQMLKIIIVYSRFTQLQNNEDHGHPKIAGASRVK